MIKHCSIAAVTILLVMTLNLHTATAQSCNDYDFSGGYTVGTVNSSDLIADLRFAMTCSNNNATNDVIDLNGATLTLTDAPFTYDLSGFNGLPPIEEPLSLQNGIIERASNLDCNGDADDRTEFRFLAADVSSAEITLNNMTLRNGCAAVGTGFDLYGGAILAIAPPLNINNVSFENNEADQIGGAVYAQDATVIANSSFVGNTGVTIFLGITADAAVTIVNTTFAENRSTILPAVYSENDSNVTLINTTISSNIGPAVGNSADAGTITIYNTIITDNSGANCTFLSPFVVDRGYSDDITCGFFGNGGLDNVVMTLGNLTRAPNNTQFYPVLSGIAIGSGGRNLLPNETDLGMDIDGDGVVDDPIDVDQRGTDPDHTRVVGAAMDAGAVEAHFPIGPDVNFDGKVSPADAVFVANRLFTNDPTADVDGANGVTTLDYNTVINALGTFTD